MNKTTLERLERINALVREEKDLSATMSEMTEQCGKIRKYCLDALEDMKDTMEAVGKVICENEHLFAWRHGCGYRTCLVILKGGVHFEFLVHDAGYFLFSDVWGENKYSPSKTFNVGGGGENGRTLSGSSYARTSKDALANYKNRIEQAKTLRDLVKLQEDADTTKVWCEWILKILEGHLKNAVDTLHMQMKDGIHAASLDYKKIGD